MPLSFPDWSEMSLYAYLAVGGAVLILTALGMHFSSVAQAKAPAILLALVGGLGVGVGAAVIGMMGFGWRWYAQKYDNGSEMGTPGWPAGEGGGGRGGQRGGGPPRAGGTRGGGPDSKALLAALITKLDLLTHKSPAVTLDPEQKRKVREQLQKLEDAKDLSEEEAKEKLDAVAAILTEDQKKTLSEAGANLPGQREGNRGGNRGGGNAPPNPFREGQANEHLKSLRSQLDDKKTE